MMKVLTDEWYSAEDDNMRIRDEARESFWAEVGVQRDRDVESIGISISGRLSNALSLLRRAGDRISDGGIIAVNLVAADLIAERQLSQSGRDDEVQGFSLGSNSPADFKAGYFLTDILPIYDLAI